MADIQNPNMQNPDMAKQRLQGARSVFNPIDLSMMRQEGTLDPNMSVLELLNKLGIDPKGPITQFKRFTMDQMGKANPLDKMRMLARGAPAQGSPNPPSTGQQAPIRQTPQTPMGGFDQLMGRGV